MSEENQLVVFGLDAERYALRLSSVERVVRAVEITPLPKAPSVISGVVNYRGRILPVMRIRERFRLPARPPRLDDHLIIARTRHRPVALVADTVAGVVNVSENRALPAGEIAPRLSYLEGIITLKDGMILIHDLDTFLSVDEEQVLSETLSALPGGRP